ncbi:hypothetical protein Trydic_g6699 [Trypoxylus dichotomus]
MRILALLVLPLHVSCYGDDDHEDVSKYLRDFGFSSGSGDGVADQTSLKGSLVIFQEYYNLPGMGMRTLHLRFRVLEVNGRRGAYRGSFSSYLSRQSC